MFIKKCLIKLSTEKPYIYQQYAQWNHQKVKKKRELINKFHLSTSLCIHFFKIVSTNYFNKFLSFFQTYPQKKIFLFVLIFCG